MTPRSWPPAGFSDVSLIAGGGEGDVWRARREGESRYVVLKRFRNNSRRSFFRELRVFMQLRHPHVVAIEEFFGGSDELVVVLEYCAGGTLRAVLNRPFDITLLQIIEVGRQIAEALAALHQEGFIHGDVKPENILRTRNTGPACWKLGDFGASTDIATGIPQQAFTDEYASPEQRARRELTSATDVYSLAVILEECLTHVPGKGDPACDELVNLVMRCLMENPNARPQAREIIRDLGELYSLALRSKYVTDAANNDEVLHFPGEFGS